MEQLKMIGDDWKSDKQRNSESRAIAARRKAGQACAKKLEAAATALTDYLAACRECADGSGDEKRGIADGRTILMHDITEYASWLNQLYTN